jgi:hypothetical protein
MSVADLPCDVGSENTAVVNPASGAETAVVAAMLPAPRAVLGASRPDRLGDQLLRHRVVRRCCDDRWYLPTHVRRARSRLCGLPHESTPQFARAGFPADSGVRPARAATRVVLRARPPLAEEDKARADELESVEEPLYLAPAAHD